MSEALMAAALRSCSSMLPVSPCFMNAWPPIATRTIGDAWFSIIPGSPGDSPGPSRSPSGVREQRSQVVRRQGLAGQDERGAREEIEHAGALGILVRHE